MPARVVMQERPPLHPANRGLGPGAAGCDRPWPQGMLGKHGDIGGLDEALPSLLRGGSGKKAAAARFPSESQNSDPRAHKFEMEHMLSQAFLKVPHLPPHIGSLQALNVRSPGAGFAADLVADPQTPPRFATDPDRLSYSPASSQFLSPRNATPFLQDQGREFMGSSPKRGSLFVGDPGAGHGQQHYLPSPKRLSMSPFASEGMSAGQGHFVSSARRLNFFGGGCEPSSAGLERMSSLGNEAIPFSAEFERLGAFGSNSCQFVSDLERLSSFINDAPSSGPFSAELERLSPLVCDLPSSSQYMTDSERLSTLVGSSSNPFVGDSEGLSALVNDPESLSPFVGDPQVSGRFECDPSQFVSDGPSSSEIASDSERLSSEAALNPFEPDLRNNTRCERDSSQITTGDPSRLVSGAQACSSTPARAGGGFRPSDRHSGSNCELLRASEEQQVHDSLESSGDDEQERSEDGGVELINLLLACTEAVASRSLSLVNPLLAQLGKLASPEGSSIQRVVAYFTEGLAYRIAETWPQLYQPLPCNLEPSEEELLAGFHILNHVCPYTKFSHFTANEAILQVFEGQDRVHVIDFDIQQGLQWPALFQSLATRPQGPPHLRITGIGECKEDIQDTGDRLAEFAEDLNLPFEFHPVVDTLEEVRLWMLHVKEKETVAVNCVSHLHRALHDDGAAVRDVLDVIKSTKPKVLVVVEQEASHNGPFEARILEALQYYSAIFDSIDASLPLESEARLKLEKLFAREIRNIVACEGLDRTERHEKLERWCDIFVTAGFEPAPLSHRAVSQAKLLLYMFTNKGYRLDEVKGALILNWLDRPLFSVSSWTVKREEPEVTKTG